MNRLQSLREAAGYLASAADIIQGNGDSVEATRAVDHIEAAEKLLEIEIKRLS
jgi:hypothetical protein